MVCLRNICINTLHQGHSDDDDDDDNDNNNNNEINNLIRYFLNDFEMAAIAPIINRNQ
jgi:hypothetical protein